MLRAAHVPSVSRSHVSPFALPTMTLSDISMTWPTPTHSAWLAGTREIGGEAGRGAGAAGGTTMGAGPGFTDGRGGSDQRKRFASIIRQARPSAPGTASGFGPHAAFSAAASDTALVAVASASQAKRWTL